MAPGDSRHRISMALCSVERNVLLAVCLSERWLKEWAGAVTFLLSACFPKPLRPCGLDGEELLLLLKVPLADTPDRLSIPVIGIPAGRKIEVRSQVRDVPKAIRQHIHSSKKQLESVQHIEMNQCSTR